MPATSANAPASTHQRICAVVLCGGRGSRMGGLDKGLQTFRGTPLAANALHRLQTQHGGAPGLIAINANRNLARYQSLGVPVWADLPEGHGTSAGDGGFAGPLAGFASALAHLRTLAQDSTSGDMTTGYELLLTVPCDAPLFPLDLLERLYTALQHEQADIAMAMAPEVHNDGSTVLRAQPVFALLHTRLEGSLNDWMRSGQRKIGTWFAQHRLARVPFDLAHDMTNAFANTNTLHELHALEQP